MVSELISRMVIAQELLPDDYALKAEYFAAFPDEWDFLKTYHKRFRTLPNVATFVGQFPDFPFQQTDRTAQWLLDEVEQDFTGTLVASLLREVSDLNEINPREAVKELGHKANNLVLHTATMRLRHEIESHSFPEDSVEWRKQLAKITTGVPTGFALLDEVTFGTQPGELEIWFARPGEGKSLMLLNSAIGAQRAGFTVSYVSPEMTNRENDYRYAALTVHVSSSGMFSGNLTDADYNEFAARMKEFDEKKDDLGELYFRDAFGHGGRFKTSDIRRIIQEDRPHIVIIDGLMLIEPVLPNRDPRIRIINIMEELKAIATDTGVPIRLAHQANRESDVKATRKHKKYALDELIPDLSHLAESGSVEQYANKVIAIKQSHGRTYLALRKNRNGRCPRFISFFHDIDHGIIADVTLEQPSNDPSERDESIISPASVDMSHLPRLPF